jgi:hypothetical protein
MMVESAGLANKTELAPEMPYEIGTSSSPTVVPAVTRNDAEFELVNVTCVGVNVRP